MKKWFCALLALILTLSACALSEDATPGEIPALGEDEILMHGYISPYANYYVGVPSDWALIGAGSTPDNISQAEETIDDSVSALIKGMTAENDVLFAVSPKGENLILTYGVAEGATNEDLIRSLDTFKKELSAKYTGIRFADDCGGYKLNDITEILYIGANYNGHDIRQYYIASGVTLYVFTFTGVSADIAGVVLSTFHL